MHLSRPILRAWYNSQVHWDAMTVNNSRGFSDGINFSACIGMPSGMKADSSHCSSHFIIM